MQLESSTKRSVIMGLTRAGPCAKCQVKQRTDLAICTLGEGHQHDGCNPPQQEQDVEHPEEQAAVEAPHQEGRPSQLAQGRARKAIVTLLPLQGTRKSVSRINS